MSDVLLKKVNESMFVVDCNSDISSEIYNDPRFYALAEGYLFNPRYKMHLWDGKTRVYSPGTHKMPIGMLAETVRFCKESGYSVSMEGFDELFDNSIDTWFDEQIKENMVNAPYPCRDYQLDAIKKALTAKKGILLSCTSSGKSLMIFNIIKTLLSKKKTQTMLIVPNVTLVEQMYTDFKSYGWNNIEVDVQLLYGEITSKSKSKKPNVYMIDYTKPVLITTWQSVMKKDREFFQRYEAVIVDECHQSKADVLKKILMQCDNAEYKIGTTGTLPTAPADNLLIKSVLGEVIFELRSKDLIDRGLLTKITIANILVKYPIEFVKTHKNLAYPDEVRYVEEYPDRNKALDLILEHTPASHNILLLVNHNEHLKAIQDYLSASWSDRKVSIINGSVSAKKREEIRTGLEEEDGTILLATFGTMSTGVNIPKLHEVILYSNSKSKIKVLQSIGRGLRKHNSKSHVILYDIIDDLSYTTPRGNLKTNYLMDHWEERKKYYIEQEFPQMTTKIQL